MKAMSVIPGRPGSELIAELPGVAGGTQAAAPAAAPRATAPAPTAPAAPPLSTIPDLEFDEHAPE